MNKKFEVEDLYLHRQVSEVHCTRVLQVAACTVRSVDKENDSYQSRIWAFDLDGGDSRQMTEGPGLDQSPRWSPDGHSLAFLSSRAGGGPRLHVMERSGGEARAIGGDEDTVVSYKWMPDSQQFIATASVDVDPELRGKRGPAPKRKENAVELVWRLPYKENGVGYLLDREVHLFTIDRRTGERRQVTDGPFEVMAFDPSPDGQRLAYSRTREGRFAHRTDLWVCDLDGANSRQISRDHAMVMQPVWSPDGLSIAFTGSKEDGDSQVNLWVASLRTGECKLVGSADLEVGDPESVHWSDDSTKLIFVAAREGCHEVVCMDVQDGGVLTLVAGSRQIAGFGLTDHSFAYAIDTMTEPSELYSCTREGKGERRLSDFNAWWRERTPLHAEIRRFDVPDGKGGTERIMGWLLSAAGASGPRPVLNDMHGGPASYALLDYDSNVFWQVLCSRGWSVLALNAVGSGSFGREFCSRLSGHWGELDLPQHIEAIAQLKRDGIANESVAISGKSYGGYLSAWSIGHTDVFKAAVVMAPVGNIETHYGTSDGGYYAEPLYMDTAPLFDRQLARSLSPLQHIEKARTPTLFLQGKEDERCPKCQSEELFVSLMRAGDTPTEMALYPGENHAFLGEGAPSCRLDAARRIVDWVTSWVDAHPVASSAPREQADARADATESR